MQTVGGLEQCVTIINMDNQFTEAAVKAGHILDVVENYQWDLGEIADGIIENYGYKALEEFSKEVESASGVKRSASSYRIYAYIWKASTKLGLPKDLMFSTCRDIVFSDNTDKYVKMVKAGASRIDVKKEIWQDKKEED